MPDWIRIMEVRAHYILIGSFTLAVILGLFTFVYWIKNVGGLGQRAIYQIQFEQPVAGLTVGSSVLFNGVRVGAVTELALDTADPKRVMVSTSLDPAIPVRADTQVDISFQGFAGAPAISLKGGEASAPRLASQDHRPPVLMAPPDVGQNLTESARATLRNIDEILTENKKPLNTAINGFSAFADMLGRNSQRIEDLIGGLQKLTGTGPQSKPPAVYDLTAATGFPAGIKPLSAKLSLPDPSAILVFDTQNILVRAAEGTYSNIENAKWADNLPKLMQARVLQSFENAQQLGKIDKANDMAEGGYKLELGIRNFQISLSPQPKAIVEFSARVVSDKGDVAGARMFNATADAKSEQPADAVAALNAAFAKATGDLVNWTVGLKLGG
ncbi:MAG: ABC-type transport auxiliary lipoprotein family protein, partial [Xanthobacteraceae bacterium]